MRRAHALPMYAALLIAPPLAAQQTGTVSGTVVAVESGAPPPGASGVIVGTVRSVLANGKGQYHLSVPPGAHGVGAGLIGYDAAVNRVTVAAGQPVTADLKLAATP